MIKEKEVRKKMKNYIGYGFRGVRKDGRIFAGIIQDMRTVNGRTLVVIRQLDDAHKSFYLEDMTGGHSFSLVNGQPVVITGEGQAMSDYRKAYNDMVALHPVPMKQPIKNDSMVGFYQSQHKRRIWAAKVRRQARG